MDYRGITIILLASAIWSCRSVKYVPVETVKTDSVYVNKVQRDSIRLQDSIFVFVKGDTVRIEKYKYLYRDRVVVDTVRLVERDSVQVAVPVEKELSRWQRWKLDLGSFAMAAIAIAVLVVVGRVVYKLKR